jgi:UDP-glucose 4-epimerase
LKRDARMAKKEILLFGGGGFIGQAIHNRLKIADYHVHIVQRDSHHDLEQLLVRCDTIIHLASMTTPSSSACHPAFELDNLTATLHLLELLQQHQQKHLIFFSSGGALYGNPEHLPVDENQLLAPLSYYGAGKVAIEAFLGVLRQQLAVTILRPSNAYGPYQPLKDGFGIIRHMLEHAYRGTVLTVWGDGKNMRDFIYIDDVVGVCEQLIQRPYDSDTYHVGSGRGYTINELIELVKKISNVDFSVEYKKSNQSGVKNIVLDTSLLKKTLPLQSLVEMEEGIRRTWQWVQQQ